MLVECPQCDPCCPELDEDGRAYTCYLCGDTGYIDEEDLDESDPEEES